jgi:hypothetical protein
MTATDPTRAQPLTPNSFAPGGYDGPPLPDPLPPTHGEPILDPLTGQREPIKYVPAGNQMIPMTASQIADLVRLHQPATQPQPEPRRGMDRTAQILLASTPASAGLGWAVSHVLQAGAAAGVTTTGLGLVTAAVVIWKASSMGRKTTHVTNNITNNTTVTSTNNSRWFGKSTTSTTTTNTHK